MHLLITGSHGFVGTNLVRALSPHHTIYALSASSTHIDGVHRCFHWNDLSLLPQVDAIIHLAAVVHDTDNRHSEQHYHDINFGLTQRIFDHFCRSSARIFIHFSSVAAAAHEVQDILTEDITPAPLGAYGTTKLAAEQYISQHTPSHKQVYILRPSMIYGVDCKGNLPLLCNLLRSGIPYPLGSFDNRRTFTSIDNVSFVVDSLLTTSIPSGIYNLCDDESISTASLVALIYTTLGRKPRVWHINKQLIYTLARMGTWLHLPFNKQRLDKLTGNFRVSNNKIKTALGIDSMPAHTHQAIVSAIQYFKEHH